MWPRLFLTHLLQLLLDPAKFHPRLEGLLKDTVLLLNSHSKKKHTKLTVLLIWLVFD